MSPSAMVIDRRDFYFRSTKALVHGVLIFSEFLGF
jgi:hypothetical protein